MISVDTVVKRIWNHIDEHADKHIQLVQEYLKQPSVSAQNLGMKECAEMTLSRLRDLGANASLVTYEGGHPIVYGKLGSDKSKKTLIHYGMYDTQPPEPLEEWTVPPFSAEIVDGKIIARGAINTKAPLMASLNSIESILETTGELPVNLIFVVEGEEEIMSASLRRFVAEHMTELKKADAVNMIVPNQEEGGDYIQVHVANKGVLFLELKATTAGTDIHSSYAPIVENPVWKLIDALQSLRDSEGRILVKGWYEGVTPIRPRYLKYMKQIAQVEDWDALRRALQIKSYWKGVRGTELVKRWLCEPTCNICGFEAGYTGTGVKTIIPAWAKVKLDLRLPPNQDPGKSFGKLSKHLKKRGFGDITVTRLGDVPSSSSPIESEIARSACAALQRVGYKPLVFPRGAFTGPLAFLTTPPLNLQFASSGIGCGTAHAPNESIAVRDVIQNEKFAATWLYEYANL